jgi:hypothetical protein
MKTLKKSEFPEWCQNQNLVAGDREWPRHADVQPLSFLVKLPDSAARTIALARLCFPFNDDGSFQGAMVWIREWGIWSEVDEETGLCAVKRLRSDLGISTPLIEEPGHVLGEEEFAEARVLWTIPMIFGWDAILFPRQSDYFVFNSHDEVVSFVSRSNETHGRLLKEFQEWKPEEDGWYFH